MDENKDLTSLTDLSKSIESQSDPSVPAPEPQLVQEIEQVEEFAPIAETPLVETLAPEPNPSVDLKPLQSPEELQTPELSQVKTEVEQAIQPQVSIPMFSIYANGNFDLKTKEILEDILSSEDFGLRSEDIKTQLDQGKLFISQISEYAAVFLSIKIREYVDSLTLQRASAGLSDEPNISSKNSEQTIKTTDSKSPTSATGVFLATLSELPNFFQGSVSKFLGIVLSSCRLNVNDAKNPNSEQYTNAVNGLFSELKSKGFKMGAHGIIGVTTSIQTYDVVIDSSGKKETVCRLQAQGTAVQVV